MLTASALSPRNSDTTVMATTSQADYEQAYKQTLHEKQLFAAQEA